ncbi:MAG: arsenic efflux protein, partial [Clostridia bacterium]|nr:arsenic efflux protein [Clostridia bacterium]
MWEVLLDAFLDTLKLSWLLLIFYILIELIEQKIADKMHAKLKSNYAVAGGSVFGIVPQCGFSVLAADLYSRRQITLGAMLAVFIATSDEALPILLSNITQDGVWLKLLVLILSKLVLALAAGYTVDIVQKVVLKKRQVAVVAGSAEVAHNDHSDKHAHAHHEHSHEDEHIHEESCKEEEEHIDIHKGCCGHHIDDAKESNVKKYIVHPLLHTLKILAYILIINVIMGMVVHFVGEDKIVEFMAKSGVLQPILVTLVGLIPNCASSVLITQLFLSDAISFGSCLGGLIVNAGLGIAFLFKENKRIKENILIVVG